MDELRGQRCQVAGRVLRRARADGSGPVTPLPEDVWERLEQALELSGRETQIIRRVFQDRKETAIAADLGISPHTVHAHLKRLYLKLGVTSRVQLVVRIFAEWISLAAPPVRRSLQRRRSNRRL